MDGDIKIKRQVSLAQLRGLVEFLKEHEELAIGRSRGRRGKLHTLKLWNVCAKQLNVYKDGAIKDGKAWSKYWCDWKYRVKKRALELKAAKESNRPPPDAVPPLSSIEESILSMIGEGAIEKIVIKMDPLCEDSEEDEAVNREDNLTYSETYAHNEPVKTTTRKRKHSSGELIDLDDHGGPSSPPAKHNPREHPLRNGDSDEDEAAAFLRLEREKLDNFRRLCDTVQTLTSEITRLTDIVGRIRDVLENERINL